MKQPLILRVFKSNQLKEVRQFDLDQIVVGSNSDAQVCLEDEAVSPIHCLIEKRDSGYYVCDLGSKVGTFKNGQAVLDESLLSGDELIIGPFKIVFFVGIPRPVGTPKDITQVTASFANQSITNQKTPEEKNAIKNNLDEDKTQVIPLVTKTTSIKQHEIPKSRPVIPAASIKAKNRRKKYSFAPGNEIQDLKTYLNPTKGSLLEINVVWNGRIIQTFHLKNKGVYRSLKNDSGQLFIPSASISSGWPLIEMGSQVKVLVPAGSKVELINNKLATNEETLLSTGKANRVAQGLQVRIDQNELLCIDLPDDQISLYIRFVESTPLVPFAPLLLSSSELGSLLIAIVISGMLAFYVATMTAQNQPNPDEEKPTYTAQVLFETPKTKVERIPPPPTPPKPPPEVVKEPPPPKEPPKVIKMADQKQEATVKGNPSNKNKPMKTQVARKALEVAPKPNSQNNPKMMTSTKQGGAVKIGQNAGANAQSATKDINKIGLFSAFGAGGVRSKLDQAYSGAGDLLGNAGTASGSTGMGVDREGDDLGSKFKDTGRGGKGTATEGIAGVGTKGRAGGTSEYGSADGFGDKTSVAIQAGGSEESFEGSIDKEAVRRRIKHNLNLIRGCYNMELNRLDKTGRKNLEGKVVLKWDIVGNGIAKNVRVSSSTLGNVTIERCIAERLATIVFPDPPADTVAEVSYPFVFKNEQ